MFWRRVATSHSCFALNMKFYVKTLKFLVYIIKRSSYVPSNHTVCKATLMLILPSVGSTHLSPLNNGRCSVFCGPTLRQVLAASTILPAFTAPKPCMERHR